MQTAVQDYSGMSGYWFVGVSSCDSMYAYNFWIGNSTLGNGESVLGGRTDIRR